MSDIMCSLASGENQEGLEDPRGKSPFPLYPPE